LGHLLVCGAKETPLHENDKLRRKAISPKNRKRMGKSTQTMLFFLNKMTQSSHTYLKESTENMADNGGVSKKE
jgi:hypothetical protein